MEDSSAPNRATTPPRHAAPAAPGQPAPGSRFWLLVAVGLVATLGAVAIGVTFNQRAVIQASSTPSVLHEDSELPVPEFETTPEVAWTGTFDLDLNAPGTIDEHTYLYTDRAGQNVNALDLRTGEGIWQVDVSELQEATGAVDVWTRAARSQDLVIVHAAGQTHAAWLLNSATGERVAELEVREDEFLYPAGDFWVGLTYRAATDTQLVRLYSFQDSELVSHWEQEMVVPTLGTAHSPSPCETTCCSWAPTRLLIRPGLPHSISRTVRCRLDCPSMAPSSNTWATWSSRQRRTKRVKQSLLPVA